MAVAPREIVVAHTSDLHLGATMHTERDLAKLRAVLDAALDAGAQALVLAGDIFDSHRAAPAIIEGAAIMLRDAPLQSVILPGNHDPATPNAVYRRFGFADPDNVHVLGVSVDGGVEFADLEMEVIGAPHADYADYTPMASLQERSMRWRIVVAHGHWVTGPQDAHRGWLIHDHEISSVDADYVALGHWDLPQPAGDGSVPAYYSGSPDLARTVNIVRFSDRGVEVERAPLVLER